MRKRRAGGVLMLFAIAAIAGGAAYRQSQRPPLVMTVLNPPTQGVVQAAAQEEQPRVLIYHTHTWEAYEITENEHYTPTETWRTQDDQYNMVAVGEELARELTARGFVVVHDTTAFEPPNLSTAYTRSLTMLRSRLDAGEQYDYLLDVHRDAYSGAYNGGNSLQVEGKDTAYVMLLVGKGIGATGAGFDERPDWQKNLALAKSITDEINALAPGLCREVKIKNGRFNQHVSTGALLIEIGNNRNTFSEAIAACPTIAEALARVHETRN